MRHPLSKGMLVRPRILPPWHSRREVAAAFRGVKTITKGRPVAVTAAFLILWVFACAGASARAAEDPDRQYRFAMALARRGDFERAAKELRTFIEKFLSAGEGHPDRRLDERWTGAGFWLGYFLHKAKKFNEAAEVLAEWISGNWRHELADRACYWRAESLDAAGRSTEARLEWRELALRFPESPRAADALESLGWSYFNGGEHERALEYAREIIKLNERNLDERKANERKANEKLDERSARRGDVAARASRLAGESLLKLDRAADALAEFDAALAGGASGKLAIESRYGRAAALQALSRHAEAAREYAEVIRLADKEEGLGVLVPEAMLAQASALVSAGEADDALKVIWRLELRPDRGAAGLRAEFWKGLALEVKGRVGEASAAYEEVLSRPEAGSVHGRAAWQLADLRHRAGDKPGAVAAYDRVVAAGDPAELADDALYNSAVTLGEIGRTEEALSRLDRFLREHPESELRADALYAAGGFLVGLGDYRGAAGRYGDFLLRFPTDERASDVRFRRGWCLNASGASEAARSELEELLRGQPTGESAAEAALLLGELAREGGHLDEAARAYEKALKAAPKSERAAEALFELSSIAKAGGRASEAEAYARRLTGEHPDSPLVPLAEIRAADVALADGRPDEALAGYRAVKERLRGHELEPAALSGEAWALSESERRREALAAFQALARSHPDTRFGVEALYRSAVLLREEGRPAEAEVTLAELLRRDPGGRFAQNAVFEKALARKASGDTDGAVSEFKAFEKSFPSSDLLPEVLCQLALAYYDKKDAEAERAAWRKILDEFPDSPEVFSAHYGLGALAESGGDWESAAREYGLAVAFAGKSGGRPEAAGAALRRAECLVRLGRKAQAWSAFREVADAFPGSPEAPGALVRAGELALEGGDHGGAVPLLERAEKLAPGSGAVLLAEALRKSGRHAEALAVAEKYVEKRLDSTAAGRTQARRAKLELALAGAALGRHHDAEGRLREVIAGADDALAARAQYELGEIYFKAGRFGEADRAFYQLVLLYPLEEWQAKGRFRLGQVNERLRDYARAREFYAELVRENPGSALAPRARERLAALGP